MLGASELIIPSGRVNSSVVESLKKQTQTVNWTCCFMRSAAFCSPAPLFWVFLLLFWFFGLGMEPNPTFAFTFAWVLKKSREGCKHLFLEIYQQTFGLFYVQSVQQCVFLKWNVAPAGHSGTLTINARTHTHTKIIGFFYALHSHKSKLREGTECLHDMRTDQYHSCRPRGTKS